MLGRELTPVDCSRHVVRWRQRIGRWQMGVPVFHCFRRRWSKYEE